MKYICLGVLFFSKCVSMFNEGGGFSNIIYVLLRLNVFVWFLELMMCILWWRFLVWRSVVEFFLKEIMVCLVDGRMEIVFFYICFFFKLNSCYLEIVVFLIISCGFFLLFYLLIDILLIIEIFEFGIMFFLSLFLLKLM